ncbi:MAG: Mov34/MPN/PAD-1 family protein [Chloroflexi bacterium]|nr:Mov34/MPN/PAD-1 family protein [Chloroflexota bacterium]
MSVDVYIPTPYRQLTQGRGHVAVQAQSIGEVIQALEVEFPGLRERLLEENDLRHYVNAYVNGEEIRSLQGIGTRVKDGDQVAFVPMLMGGADRPPRGEWGIELSPEVYQAAVSHAQDEYPNECCGLFAGRRGSDGTRVERFYPMANVERSPLNYRMDPQEQLRVFEEIDRLGLDLVGIFHSHTHSPAYPSQTDIRLAFYPDQSYVIASLGDREQTVVRSFRIADGEISEEEVLVR